MKQIIFILFLILGFNSYSQDINQIDAKGKRHGVWKKTFQGTDVLRYEGQFEHGKETGLFKFYKYIDKKGVLSATKDFHKDGSADVKFYSSKGKVISEGKMIDTLHIGKWIFYHNNSTKTMIEEQYNLKGKLEGERKVYYPNGNLAETQVYKNGKLNGVSKLFGEEGILLNEYTYTEGLLHGPVKIYDTSGQLIAEGSYKKNKQHGIWKYYENGKLKEQKDFTPKSRNPYLKKQ